MKHSLRSHEAFALQTRSIELKFNMKQSVPLEKHAPKVRFIGQSPASFFMCEARFISKKKSTSEEVLFFLAVRLILEPIITSFRIVFQGKN